MGKRRAQGFRMRCKRQRAGAGVNPQAFLFDAPADMVKKGQVVAKPAKPF